jgi:glycosyltransferase involved in cell wall biosynthesis
MFRNYLQAHGHQVDLIAPDYAVDPQIEDPEHVFRIPARTIFFDPEDRLMKASEVMSLEQTLRARAYDLIHVHTPFVAHYAGLRLSQRLGIPCIETFHTHFEAYAKFYLPWIPAVISRWAARRITKMQCNAVDYMVAPSETIKKLLQEYGVEKPIHVVSTGIRVSDFGQGDGEGFREKYAIEAGRPLLLTVGRIAHEKNIGFLLQVMHEIRKEMPEAQLLIAGEGPAKVSLMRKVSQLGLDETVRFVGYLSRARDLVDCYHAADAFVFSSRTETQGLVLIEAMAAGLPVISTAFLGTREVLLPCTGGALVCEENVDEFTRAILSVLRNQSIRQTMSSNALEYSHAWGVDVFGKRMMTMYTNLLDSAETPQEVVLA